MTDDTKTAPTAPQTVEAFSARLADLSGHCLVGIRPALSLPATGPSGPAPVVLAAQVAVNDPKTMVYILRGGRGIGVVPRFLAQAGLDDGSLEILLPDHRLPPAGMSVVYHGPAAANPRADLFATFLQTEMRDRATGLRRDDPRDHTLPAQPIDLG